MKRIVLYFNAVTCLQGGSMVVKGGLSGHFNDTSRISKPRPLNAWGIRLDCHDSRHQSCHSDMAAACRYTTINQTIHESYHSDMATACRYTIININNTLHGLLPGKFHHFSSDAVYIVNLLTKHMNGIINPNAKHSHVYYLCLRC